MNYCYNHDVATRAYDCPHADVVNNAICCNCEECNYNSIAEKSVVNNSSPFATFKPTPYEDIAANLLANSLKDEEFPF